MSSASSPSDFERFLPFRSDPQDRESLFRTGPRKLLQDGSLGARTALLREGYADDPNWKGMAIYSPEELESLIEAAHRARMDVAVHTIGDGALEQLCQAVEAVQARDPWPQARHGAVHAQITDPDLLKRMKALGLQAYIQPIFIEADMGIITQRVGEKRAKDCYNWRSMLVLGISVSGGSDCPVEPFDVLDNLRAAVTRQDRAGERTYLPQQALPGGRPEPVYLPGGLGQPGRGGSWTAAARHAGGSGDFRWGFVCGFSPGAAEGSYF